MDRKKFDEVYDLLINLWPEEIDVSEKLFHDNGGVTINNLVFVHDNIEKELIKVDGYDEYLYEHVDWAIFRLLHSLAKHSKIVYPQDIEKDEVFRLYEENEKAIKE